MKGIINIPSFDVNVFEQGVPLQVIKLKRWNSEFKHIGDDDLDKFESGDFGIIREVNKLSLTLRMANDKLLRININAVSNKEIQLNFMEVVENA